MQLHLPRPFRDVARAGVLGSLPRAFGSLIAACLIGLAALGAIGTRVGGSDVVRGTLRVTFWGTVAMAATASIGALIGRVD